VSSRRVQRNTAPRCACRKIVPGQHLKRDRSLSSRQTELSLQGLFRWRPGTDRTNQAQKHDRIDIRADP